MAGLFLLLLSFIPRVFPSRGRVFALLIRLQFPLREFDQTRVMQTKQPGPVGNGWSIGITIKL